MIIFCAASSSSIPQGKLCRNWNTLNCKMRRNVALIHLNFGDGYNSQSTSNASAGHSVNDLPCGLMGVSTVMCCCCCCCVVLHCTLNCGDGHCSCTSWMEAEWNNIFHTYDCAYPPQHGKLFIAFRVWIWIWFLSPYCPWSWRHLLDWILRWKVKPKFTYANCLKKSSAYKGFG